MRPFDDPQVIFGMIIATIGIANLILSGKYYLRTRHTQDGTRTRQLRGIWSVVFWLSVALCIGAVNTIFGRVLPDGTGISLSILGSLFALLSIGLVFRLHRLNLA